MCVCVCVCVCARVFGRMLLGQARCALGWSVETAKLAREHNNAQVIGIGGRMHTEAEMLAIVDAFLSTPWSQAPRHQRRIDILAEYERTHVAPPVPGAGH